MFTHDAIHATCQTTATYQDDQNVGTAFDGTQYRHTRDSFFETQEINFIKILHLIKTCILNIRQNKFIMRILGVMCP
jgi:hypothetical protein